MVNYAMVRVFDGISIAMIPVRRASAGIHLEIDQAESLEKISIRDNHNLSAGHTDRRKNAEQGLGYSQYLI